MQTEMRSPKTGYASVAINDEIVVGKKDSLKHSVHFDNPWNVFTIVLVLMLVITAFGTIPSIVGGAKLLGSVANVGFSCFLVNAIGQAAIAFPVVCLILAVVLALPLKLLKIHQRIVQFSRNGSTLKRILVFSLLYLCVLVVLLIFIALAVGSILFYQMSENVPNTSANFASVKGITGDVTIERDKNGIPHIRALTRHDAVFGQGFVHAQDRLWQVEFQRLASQGRLAEHVGSAALKFDKQSRTLNFAGAGKRMCAAMSPHARGLVQSYIDGINFYLNSYSERPPEFLFMSKHLLKYHEPEPYVIDDICCIGKLVQWTLSFNLPLEVERFKIFWKTDRTYEEINELYLNQTNISHTILTAEQLNLSQEDAVRARERESRDSRLEQELYDTYMNNLKHVHAASTTKDVKEEPARKGEPDLLHMKRREASNAWAARAAGGSPCGASDPHLQITMPAVWYYAHLEWDGFMAAGVGMLGLPGVHIGKTSAVSWGITMAVTDIEDLYLMVPDPAFPDTHYMHNGRSVAYTIRTETIHVRYGDSVTLSVQESLYGPIATEALKLPAPLKFAVHSRVILNDTTSIEGIVNFNEPTITNVVEFRQKVLSNIQSPAFSIPSADVNGDIAWGMTGKHPLRAKGHTGKFPTLGNGTFDYLGLIPYSSLPTLVIPASASQLVGRAVSCGNQKIYPDGYAYTLGYDFVTPFRGGRMQEVLGSNQHQYSNATFHRQLQRDVQSNIWTTQFRGFVQSNKQKLQSLCPTTSWVDKMLAWDGQATKGQTYSSFFWLWYRELAATPQDALKALEDTYWIHHNFVWSMCSKPTAKMNRDCQARRKNPNAHESNSSCVALCMETFCDIAAQYPEPPQWGFDLNVIHATNLMMHGSPLKCMFDRKTTKDGDGSSLNVANSDLEGNMKVHGASSMKQLYDWNNPNQVQFALPGGENGNPYSTFYDNLMPIFSKDDYVRVDFSPLPSKEQHSKQKLSPTSQ